MLASPSKESEIEVDDSALLAAEILGKNDTYVTETPMGSEPQEMVSLIGTRPKRGLY